MTLKRNIIANYLGQGWTGVVGLAFVPVYIKYIGIEAYGLIGIFVLLQTWIGLLDMGMSPTLNREVARQAAGASSPEYVRDLIRTFELISIAIALLTVLTLLSVSDWIAQDWLKSSSLPTTAVSHALSIMGLIAALRFIEGIYRGAILGLQMHVFLNVANSLVSTVRAIGAVFVLAYIEPTIRAFFWWQAVVSAVSLVILFFGAHRHLPRSKRSAAFSFQAISNAWKFAGGLFATTFLTLLLTQIDKLILSRLLTLEMFGIYVFAGTVAGVLFQLIGPIAQSFYPKLTELTTSGDEKTLAKTYHQGAQLMTIMLVPAGMLLIVFGEQILYAWTGNKQLAENASLLVAILSIGTILNGWMHIPYMLQLASGWSTFAVWTNLVAAIILVPAIFWAAPRYGPIGAAWVWVTINAGYVLLAIHFMHLRLLPKEKITWYTHDLAAPTLTAGMIVSISYILHHSSGRFGDAAWTGVTGGLAYVAAILGSSRFRRQLFEWLPLIKRRSVK